MYFTSLESCLNDDREGSKFGVFALTSSSPESSILVDLNCCQIDLKAKGHVHSSFSLLFHSIMAYFSKLTSFMVIGLI